MGVKSITSSFGRQKIEITEKEIKTINNDDEAETQDEKS